MLTQQRLKELLWYDPITGVFRWRKQSCRTNKAWDVAGSLKKRHGYWEIGIDKKVYGAHRLAFLYMTGKFPEIFVDHIDRKRTNNAWENLRQANYKQNAENRSVPVDNVSGILGVTWHKQAKKWQAQIGHKGKTIYLGLFETKDEASIASIQARQNLFSHYKGETN